MTTLHPLTVATVGELLDAMTNPPKVTP